MATLPDSSPSPNPARHRRTVDDALALTICDLYASGLGSDAVSKQVGRSPSTVLRVLYERGVTLRKTHRQGWALEWAADDIVRRYRAGESTHSLADFYGVLPSSITYTLQRRGVHLRHQRETSRVYTCDCTLFTKKPLSDVAAYICGLLATDGCVSRPQPNTFVTVIALQERDAAILETVRKALRYEGPLGLRRRGHEGRQDQAVLAINSPQLAHALIALGIVPRKTHSLTVADGLASHSGFWRGAWDGDGTIGWWRSSTSITDLPVTGITTASRSFADQCREFCRGILPNYTTSVYRKRDRRKGHNALYALHFAARKAARLLKVLYEDAEVAIPRKLQLAREAIAMYS